MCLQIFLFVCICFLLTVKARAKLYSDEVLRARREEAERRRAAEEEGWTEIFNKKNFALCNLQHVSNARQLRRRGSAKKKLHEN